MKRNTRNQLWRFAGLLGLSCCLFLWGAVLYLGGS